MSLRLGIIGMGYAGLQHYRCAQLIDGVTVTGVAEPQPFGHRELAAEVEVFRDWRQLIAGDIQLVSICTPHCLHGEMVAAALSRGLHVLVEKPLAATLSDARAIVQQAASADRVLMVELTHRFYPPVCAAAKFVAAGGLGELYAVEDRVIEPVSSQIAGWMQQRVSAGGGVALTNGVHMLDRVAFVTGQRLTFRAGRIGYHSGLGDIEDTAAMLLTLDDGTPVQVLAAWPRGAGRGDDELTLYGSAGTLRVWAWRGWRFDPLGGIGENQSCYARGLSLAERARLGIGAALLEFVDAVRQSRAPNPQPTVALEAQELISELYAMTRDP